tara:strand:+ start:4243 stop:4614 length:372 start_codon:yes stop_codon:yes gene_type:complete
MTLKTFKIDYKGKKEIIEYEDDITYGEMEAILEGSIDISDISKVKVNIPKYRMNLLLKVLRKAPFPVGDTVSVRNLSMKEASSIMRGVMKSYPLQNYLQDWVETFTGSPIKIDPDTVSTTSVQ